MTCCDSKTTLTSFKDITVMCMGGELGGDFAVGPVSLPGLGFCFLFTIMGGYMLRTQQLLCGYPNIIRNL